MVERRGDALKIVVLGEARVGKTSISLRFVNNTFNKEQMSTVDASFLDKKVNVGERTVKLNIWDTAGQEKYHALAKNYYQGASGALLVYDVTDLDSFEKVKTWYFELRKYIPKEAPIIIAGNKCDIVNRTVELEDAEKYAKEIGIEHVSASALSGHNVNYVFNTLAQKMVDVLDNSKKDQAATGGARAGGRRGNRGAFRAEGVQGFDPTMNVQLTRKSEMGAKARKDDKKEKAGCCK